MARQEIIDVFIRVNAPQKKDHSTHWSQNNHFRVAADSDLGSRKDVLCSCPTNFRGNAVLGSLGEKQFSTDKMIYFIFLAERLEQFPNTASSPSQTTCLPP